MLSLVSLLRYVSFDDCGYMGSVYEKIYAINGSPRKNKNTAILLDNVLEGAKMSILILWWSGLTCKE